MGRWVNQAGVQLDDEFSGHLPSTSSSEWRINDDPTTHAGVSGAPFDWVGGTFNSSGFFENVDNTSFKTNVANWSECFIFPGNTNVVTTGNTPSADQHGTAHVLSGTELVITPSDMNGWGMNDTSLSSVYLSIGNATTYSSSWEHGDILYTTDHTWAVPAVAFYVEDNAGNPSIFVNRFGVNVNEPRVNIRAYTGSGTDVLIDDHQDGEIINWINDDDPYFEWDVDVVANGVTHYSILMAEPGDGDIVPDKEEDYTSAVSSWNIATQGVPDDSASGDAGLSPENMHTSAYGSVTDDTSAFNI